MKPKKNPLLPVDIKLPERVLLDHGTACWCPLDGSCHADVLLMLANN